ncbi:MAG: Na+/H+ antiporter NhaA [Flavobacterium sp.]|uniref:Na+/H+ antiporter NhaA n=1 Tax=Flavobacterium sp. TaxID=239 RepID=UPI003262EE87
MKSTKLFKSFFESEKTGGIILLICTIFSMLLANSYFQKGYIKMWHGSIGNYSIEHIINDGLMTIFFLMIGLELERELYIGELSKIKNAMLPIAGAIGGMLFPALIYFIFNHNTNFKNGIGIPMATDIAFAIGILSLLGNKVPISLKIFLTALAVIDDLGAIIIIALFYSESVQLNYLFLAIAIWGLLFLFNRMKVYNLWIYLIGGIFMWYFMMNSGIHATITGVVLAFVIPFQKGEETSISYKLQNWLHKPVSFIILPIFALANTAIIINLSNSLFETYSVGIALGLILGKPLGIILFSYIFVKLKLAKLPFDLSWKHISGAGILGGIGFTMSIFITLLAFDDAMIINNSKLFIIIASFTSGIIGLLFLKRILKTEISEEIEEIEEIE